VTIHNQMAVLVEHRYPASNRWMLSIHKNAASKLRRVGKHACDCRRQIPVEDSQSHIPFENATKVNHRLITKPKTISFLNSNGFRQLSDIDARRDVHFRWVIGAKR